MAKEALAVDPKETNVADVTGPINTLPGCTRTPPADTMCDDHPNRPAVARVQGETDSMGSEQHDLCAECLRQIQVEHHDTSGRCDWCKLDKPARIPTRDYDEGSSGPVYYVCAGCRRDYFKQLREENEDRYGDDW